MLYFFHETNKQAMKPVVQWLKATSDFMQHIEPYTITPIPKLVKASLELMYQLTRTYPKNNFDITSVVAQDGKSYKIKEANVLNKSFCSLKHFKKIGSTAQQTLLIVVPLSGHYATLLKDTVKSCLKDFDVYITDWNNANEIPVNEGDFGFEDYMLYCEEFISYLKAQSDKLHVMAVCQPTVPVLGVVSYLEKHDPKNSPDSVVLMGGPIDTREAPTEVNNYAMRHDINWFKSHVIHTVPVYFKGFGRKVYPGFLQHAGFLAMNLKKHEQAHIDFFNHLVEGADLDAQKHRDFYEEYNSVGLTDIKKVRVLSIEGELDDISGPGQTHAVIKLTDKLPASKKTEYTAPQVGHYGLFSGRRWRQEIYPKIANYLINNKL